MDATMVGLTDDRPHLHEKLKEPSSASCENSRKRIIRRLHEERRNYKVLNYSAGDLHRIGREDEESKTSHSSRKDPLSQSEPPGGPQIPLNQIPLPIRHPDADPLSPLSQSGHVRRPLSQSEHVRGPLSQSEHVRGNGNYDHTAPRRSSGTRASLNFSSISGAGSVSAGGDRPGNLPRTSNIRETTIELLELIRRRRRKVAANPMPPMRNRQKSSRGISSDARLPKVAPALIPSRQQTISDVDESLGSPKCIFDFPIARKRASPETKRKILEEAHRKEEEDRKMRLEIASMRQRLDEVEQHKYDDLVQLKQSMEEQKAKLKNEAKARLAEHLEAEMELQQLAMDAEEKGIANLKEELEDEQIELQATVAEIQEMNDGMVTESEKLKAANNDLFRMYTSLSQWVMKKTLQNRKLVQAKPKFLKILKGFISLAAEARQSKIYRKWIYKCAFGVKFSDLYSFQLDEEIMTMIQECETECNKEVIDLTDLDAMSAQHDQERDPLHDIMFQSKGIDTTSSQELPTSSFSIEGLDPMDLSGDDDECFDKSMDELDQSMAVYENIVANISVKLDATQMSTLYENKQMLLTLFRFLDTDGSGGIDAEEFRAGIELLNKRLPEESHFQEPEELFELLDVDGNGTIDIKEFEKIFVDD